MYEVKRGRGRPRKDDTLSYNIKVHVDEEMREMIMRRAAEEDLSVSEMVRKAVMEYCGREED